MREEILFRHVGADKPAPSTALAVEGVRRQALHIPAGGKRNHRLFFRDKVFILEFADSRFHHLRFSLPPIFFLKLADFLFHNA